MTDSVFNSRAARCKSPFGAVASGIKVRLTAYPEASRFPLRGFVCVEYERSGEVAEIPMDNLGEQDGRIVYTAAIDTAGYVGLCFYHFRFENDGGCFRYGARAGRTGGECEFYGNLVAPPFQLTVYEDEKDTSPEWFGDGVTYQIFPDRFARTTDINRTVLAERGRYLHEDWSDVPNAQAVEFEGRYGVYNTDFYGGSLRGIIEKLDYLASLGVTCIYLNPIFEAFSNHRYDTGDYHKIDPLLGDEETFREMCAKAMERGIRVVLDGVFNHTGSDSLYFNKRGTYGAGGAYNDENSPYVKWYNFVRYPHRYVSWWGIDTLPETNETDPSFRDFIAGEDNPESVVRYWLNAGASGWRLDVADEIPDEFIAEITRAARREKSDAFVVGEVWEDASNKISYSKRRAYILGGMLDGVMGYMFRTAILAYLYGGSAHDFRDSMLEVEENYPPKVFMSSMNILGTHDTPRIVTVLGTTAADWLGSKEQRGLLVCHPDKRERAVKLVKIASLVQFCFPGSPCVYYGDEAGLEGAEDPFNRRGYPWGNEEKTLVEWYARLGAARKEFEPLRRGKLEYLGSSPDVLAFSRILNDDTVYAVVNRAGEARPCPLKAGVYKDFMSGETLYVSHETTVQPYAALLVTRV